MLEEFELDIQENRLYFSHRLSSIGTTEYPGLLKAAIESGNDASLAEALRNGARLNATEQRRKPKGGYTTATVPVTAADTMTSSIVSMHVDCVGAHMPR